MLRSAAASRAVCVAALVAARLCASRTALSIGVALLVDDVVELAVDLVVHAAEVVAGRGAPGAPARSCSSSSRRPCSCSPLRSRMPSCIIRRRAALTSPWYSSSSVSSSNSASASRSNPRLRAVPPRVREPLRHERQRNAPFIRSTTRSRRGARIIRRMRVPRTFVFVDLSGFTNYTAAFGDDAAGRILSTFRAIVREVASERGVRIAKWLGDGCMVVGVEQTDAIDVRARPRAPRRRRVRPAHAPRRHRHRARAAVRGRRLHRLGRQHGGPAVRRRPAVRGADADHAARAAPGGRHGRAVRRDRAARLPRPDRRRPPHGCPVLAPPTTPASSGPAARSPDARPGPPRCGLRDPVDDRNRCGERSRSRRGQRLSHPVGRRPRRRRRARGSSGAPLARLGRGCNRDPGSSTAGGSSGTASRARPARSPSRLGAVADAVRRIDPEMVRRRGRLR